MFHGTNVLENIGLYYILFCFQDYMFFIAIKSKRTERKEGLKRVEDFLCRDDSEWFGHVTE